MNKKTIKKWFLTFLCAVMTFANSFSNFPLKVHAADAMYVGTVKLEAQGEAISIPGIGTGNAYKILVDGKRGFCLDFYSTTATDLKYTRNDAKLSSLNSNIFKAVNFYQNNSEGTDGTLNGRVAQTVIWGFIHGKISTLDPDNSNTSAVNATKDFIDDVMTDLEGSSWSSYKSRIDKMNQMFPDLNTYSAVEYLMLKIHQSSSSSSGMHYFYKNGRQPILTFSPGVWVEPFYATVTKTASTNENIVINISKTDANTAKGLEGVKFDLYDGTTLLGTLTTNSNGTASYSNPVSVSATGTAKYCANYNDLNDVQKSDVDSEGVYKTKAEAEAAALSEANSKLGSATVGTHTYKLIETATRSKYYLNTANNTWTKTQEGSGTVTFNITNTRQTGNITVTKTDSATGNGVAGAVYELYAKNNIVHPDGKTGTVYNAGSLVATFAATNSSGQATLTDLYLGDYYIKEKTAPNNYVLNSTTKDVSLTSTNSSQSVVTNSVSMSNVRQTGTITITKKDNTTSNPLSDAVFELYARNNIVHPDGKTGVIYSAGTKVATFPATNASGTTTLSNLYLGNYYVVEKTAPYKYVLDSTSKNISLAYEGQTVSVSVETPTYTNAMQTGTITINKSDVETGNGLNGVVYELYAKENISHPDGKTGVVVSANNLVATFPATSNGKTTLSGLYLGKYYVKEKSTIAPYIKDSSTHDVELAYAGQTANVSTKTLSLTNTPQKGSVVITKKDVESGNVLDGAVFELYARENIMKPDGTGVKYSAGSLVATFPATDNSGKTRLDGLYVGKYTVKEKTAPNGYLVNTTSHNIDITYQGATATVANTATVEHTNKSVRGEVSMQKVDAELYNQTTTHSSQGDGFIQGATYGLYAKENVVHPDGTTGVVKYNTTNGNANELKLLKGSDLVVKDVDATAGTLIATAKTDANGEIVFGNLYLGDYYIKEVEASEGYLIDASSYDFVLNYKDQNTGTITTSKAVSKELVKKQAFQILKISMDEDDQDAEYLEGVEFTAILNKYVEQYGTFEEALKVAKLNDGRILPSEWDVLTTDENGYATSKELPYGKYHVKETVCPDDKIEVADFFVEIKEDSRTPKSAIIKNNLDYKEYLTIQKVDAETGKIVKLANTTFKVKDLSTGKYIGKNEWIPDFFFDTEWRTDDNGMVTLSNQLKVGKYEISEIKAPEGYVLGGNVQFEIKKRSSVTIDGNTNSTPINLFVEFENEPVKGQIEIEKRGDVLVGTNVDVNGNHEFLYEEKPLANAIYGVYAEENIMDPSNDGTILYKANDLVEEITTGTNGKALSSKLPLGKYYVKEHTAPEGFVINKTVEHVELKYKDQNTAVIMSSLNYVNNRQLLDIIAMKVDDETNEFVEGAEFTLYADQDIYAYDGTKLLSKDDKVKSFLSDANGKVSFGTDLPLVTYYARETKAPLGYVSNSTPSNYDGRYRGQDQSLTTILGTFRNKPTVVSISKQDITTGVEVAGNILQVFDKDGNLIDEWTSVQDEEHIIKYLHVGETYRLVEYLAKEGYLKADDVEFTILDTEAVQKVEMKDELVKGKISVTKTGEVLTGVHQDTNGNTVFEYTEKPLQNAVFEVYANEDIKHPDGKTNDFYKKGDLVATITTGTNGVATTEELPLGKYKVVEKTAPEGFVLNNKEELVELKYVDQNTRLVFDNVSYLNERQKVEVDTTKVDAENNTPLMGAEFTIYASENIYDYKGNLLVSKDKAIETIRTDANGKAKFVADLPLYNYYVKETKAPIGYATTDKKVDIDATYQGQSVTLVSGTAGFSNEITKVEISKTDITTGKEVVGAQLAIYPVDNEGKPILSEAFATWISNETPYMVMGLEINKDYMLREIVAPFDLGYVTAEDVIFHVDDTGAVQKVEMKDDYTKLEVSKVDVETGDYVIGTQLSLIPVDEDGNLKLGETFATWLTTDEAHLLEYVPVGEYILRETLTGQAWDYGYVTAEDLKVVVKDTPNVQKVEMKDDFTKLEISKTDLTTGKLVEGAELKIIPVGEDGTLKEGEVFDTWITSDKPHCIERIPVGKYVLRETLGLAANFGYVSSEDVLFEVKDTAEIQKVEMKDDHTKVEISKTDITTGNPVVGAQLSVMPVDEEGNVLEGEIFETWITTEEPHMIEYLPLGDYVLREKLTGKAWDYGYVTAEDVYFTVTDTPKIQKVEMKDDYTKVIVNKLDVVTKEPIPNTMLALIPVNENGELLLGETYVMDLTNEKGQLYAEYVPVGNYVIREMSANFELGYATAEDILIEVKDTPEIQEYLMEDDHTKLEITKTDIVTGEPVLGAELSIIPVKEDGTLDEGATFDTWITEEEPHFVEYIPVGKYVLREKLGQASIYGYVTAEDVEFEVLDTGEIQKVEMKDDYTKVEFMKVNANGETVVGATLQVIPVKEDGTLDEGAAFETFLSSEEAYSIERLPVGSYVLRELSSPEGYAKALDLKFEVLDTPDLQSITLVNKQVILHKVDQNGNYVEGAVIEVIDDETKEVVDTWTTEKEGHVILNLEVGKKYTVKETKVPKGYAKAKDGQFVVENDGKNQEYKMIDKLIPNSPVTADNSNIKMYAITGIGSLMIILAILIIEKRKRGQVKNTNKDEFELPEFFK